MANENWVKAKVGVRQFVPVIAVGTGIIVLYAVLVRIFAPAYKEK